ncbi:MAG TPA: hypothetical protein VD867_01770 [Burkholderiales bacterium]|nr:hypothetical protein [Burkholderiales bacterium]
MSIPTTSSDVVRRGRPRSGEAQSAAERMRRYRRRQKAAGLRLVARYEQPARIKLTSTELDRRIIEARDLTLHCLAAKKIDADRTLLGKVRRRLEYWRRNHKEDAPPAALSDWADVLSKPWGAIAAFITGGDPEASRLRHSSPFDIVLTARERKRIYSAFAP